MEYRAWLAELQNCQRGYQRGRITVEEAHEGIVRLRSMLAGLPQNRLDWGEAEIASFENQLTPEAGERAVRAVDAYRRGIAAQGSDQERVDAMERAIDELGSIANETSDKDEQRQITGPAEALSTEIEFLKDRMAKNAAI